MKRLTLFSLLSLLLTASNFLPAQQLTLTDIPSHLYEGVKSIDGEMLYVFSSVDKSFTDRDLILISPELKELSRQRLTLGRLVEVETAASNGKSVLIHISSDKTALFLLFDMAGKELKRMEADAPSNWLNTSMIYPKGNDGYYVVRPAKEKKKGFQVELLGMDLSSKWKKAYIPEKGKYELAASGASDGLVAVAFKNGKTYEVVSLKADGSEAYRKPIPQEGMTVNPTHVAVKASGEVAVMGTYEDKAVVTDSDQSHRYFMQVLDASGGQKAFEASKWDETQIAKITSQNIIGDYSQGAPPHLYFHSFESNGPGFTAVAETYKFINAANDDYPIVGGGAKVSGADMPTIQSRPAYFLAMDLVTIDYDLSGKVTRVVRTGRPAKRTATTGMMNSSEPASAASSLVDYGRFNYRFSNMGNDGVPMHIVMGQHFTQSYAGFVHPGEAYENIFTRDYLRTPIAASIAGSGEKATANFKYESLSDNTKKTNKWIYETEILPATAGKYAVAQYRDRTVTLTLNDIEPAPNSAALKGVATSNVRYSPFFDEKMSVLYYSEAGDNGENWVWMLIDKNNNIVDKEMVVLPSGASRIQSYLNEGTLLMTYTLPSGDDFVFAIDRKGTRIGPEVLQKLNTPKIQKSATTWQSAGNKGFYGLIPMRNTEENLVGYKVFLMNNQLKEEWSKDYWETQPMSATYQLLTGNAGACLVQERRQITERKKFFQYFTFNTDELVQIDASGTRTQLSELLSETEWHQAQVFAGDDGSEIMAGGVKFNSPDGKEWTSEGLWFQTFAGGKASTPEVISWNKIAAELKAPDLEEKMKKGELRFRLLAVSSPGGTPMLLTEMVTFENVSKNPFQYRSGNGVLADYVVFDFDNAGKYTGHHIIKKVPLNLSTIGNAMTVFSYQYLNNKGANMVFVDLGDDFEPYALSTSLGQQEPRVFPYAHARMFESEKPEEPYVWDPSAEFQKEVDAIGDKIDKFFGKKPPPPTYTHQPSTGFIDGGTNRIFVFRHEIADAKLRLDAREMK